MSAQDHLQPMQFFHGTTAELRPGSHIRPAAESGLPANFSGYGNEAHAYATASLPSASTYAEHALDWAYNRDAGHGKTSRVYQVEPTGDYEPDPDDTNQAYRTQSSWRVTRRVPASETR